MNSNKPKLSDIARQNNAAKVSKFANTMVPPAPVQPTEPVPADPEPMAVPTDQPKSVVDVVNQGDADFTAGKGTVPHPDEMQTKVQSPDSSSAVKPGRKRSSSQLSLDDILNLKAPDDEGFAKMARISDKHHALLRKIAYEQRKPMNTIMYNLLEALDQAYQRDQQNHV